MIDALDFAAYMVTDVVPYSICELVSIAMESPALIAVALFVLWSLYVLVSAVLRHIRILVLIGTGYVAVIFLQRYLAR